MNPAPSGTAHLNFLNRKHNQKRRSNMSSTHQKVIAVFGATGQQGGGVVRALQASGQFKVRALSRNPHKSRDLADEVVEADLNRPETLPAALAGAHGVFLVTNFWEQGTDELKQATAAIRAARDAGVSHFIWSTLPNVEAISGGKLDVPHFTAKARIDAIVQQAGFTHHTFVIAPFYYQNLVGQLAPQKQADGSVGWTIPMDPNVRGMHIGDPTELGHIVAGAFAHPEQAGNGEYLPLVGDFLSFREIVDTLNRQGHRFSINQVPGEVYAGFFPGAKELAATFRHFEENTYLGSPSLEAIALANKLAGRTPTTFENWARQNFPVKPAAVQPAAPSPLSVQVSNADSGSFHVNAVLVSGQTDAVLLDTGFTRADALRIAAMVLESKKTLRTIYISQADPDFYFGIETSQAGVSRNEGRGHRSDVEEDPGHRADQAAGLGPAFGKQRTDERSPARGPGRRYHSIGRSGD